MCGRPVVRSQWRRHVDLLQLKPRRRWVNRGVVPRPSRCARPDLDHSWFGTHWEGNFLNPNGTVANFLSDGFVRVNDLTEQLDNGTENATEDQTIGYYNQDDIPFYYDLAQKFAISDRHFASVLGPTFPNRSYLMASTSFG